MTPEYIAGFFDGEGCIYVHPSSTYLQVELAQKDNRPLYEIAGIYGGNVRRGADLWKWYCPSHSVEKFLLDILPHLIVKKRQAELALELRKLRCPKIGVKIGDSLFQERLALASQIKAEKHCL